MFSLLPFSDVEISQINGKTEIKETKINIRCERNVLLIFAARYLFIRIFPSPALVTLARFFRWRSEWRKLPLFSKTTSDTYFASMLLCLFVSKPISLSDWQIRPTLAYFSLNLIFFPFKTENIYQRKYHYNNK